MSVVDLLPSGSWAPALPDAEQRVDALERRLGHRLPPDLRAMYPRCDRVSIHGGRYIFVSPDQVAPLAKLQIGDDTDDYCPRTWLAVIDLQDGDFIGVDVVPNADGSYDWLDCCHETIGEAKVIATSLEELVSEVLLHPDAHDWLVEGHKAYRRIVYENPPSYWRRLHGDWYRRLGHELGPGRCTTLDCPRLRIPQSVRCRRHHYEMVHKRPSPFDDD